jgi:Protein of unknown function (DUF2795)
MEVPMATTEMWTFRDEALARIDLHGYEVHARDGAVGEVVQAVEGHAGGYLIVDPGVAMPFRGQLLVPAGLVEKVDVDDGRVSVRADRRQITNAPEYDRERPLDERSRSMFGDYFRSLFEGVTGHKSQRAPSRSTRGSGRTRASQRRARTGSSSSRAGRRSRTADEPTKEELYDQARKLDIEGRSKMSKPELARAVNRRRGQTSRKRGSSAAKANPVEVQSFLEGVGYPTEKKRLLREAESRRASRNVRATLRRLPDKQFKSPTEVSKAIGKLD